VAGVGRGLGVVAIATLALAPRLEPGAPPAPSPSSRSVAARLDGQGIRLEFDDVLHSRVVSTLGGVDLELGPFAPSESASVAGVEVDRFALAGHELGEITDSFGRGRGRRLTVRGVAAGLAKTVVVATDDSFPGVAVYQVRYTNESDREQVIDAWTNNHHVLSASSPPGAPAFWSYQGGSYESRPDWVLPLAAGFAQDNFQGMNATDYGGGTPVVDVWRRDVGLAVGHLEPGPRLVSLPVAMPDPTGATVGVRERRAVRLVPGQSFDTLRTFVAVHHGDHFQPLSVYRRLMALQGLLPPAAPPAAFEPIWCAWGYGREFTPDQVVGTLPVAKRLGFAWATLDDGWQVAEGDWRPLPSKFPRGDADMKALVDRIHAQGLKAMLWWAPLAADPGTRLLKDHPDQLLLEPGGGTRKITWWDASYLCPAYGPVREDAHLFARKALGEWGFDGLKIDGQHLNGAPPCHNPAHGHARPEASAEGVPGFFAGIRDAAVIVGKPDAVIEICPCGTAYSFFTLRHLNLAVASDPTSSWQIRLKGKTLKALMGDEAAYFGDHVELSTGGEDFASTLGVGGVVGSNFAWPGAPGKKDPQLLLTPAREESWAFWVRLYQEKRLSQGKYRGGLYDIGFDRPEAHVVEKDGRLHYAFYAPHFEGAVELRGLGEGAWAVRDYVAGRDLGRVQGPTARLAVSFKDYLLLEARPERAAASSRSALPE
jgi:alpha-galactosidase